MGDSIKRWGEEVRFCFRKKGNHHSSKNQYLKHYKIFSRRVNPTFSKTELSSSGSLTNAVHAYMYIVWLVLNMTLSIFLWVTSSRGGGIQLFKESARRKSPLTLKVWKGAGEVSFIFTFYTKIVLFYNFLPIYICMKPFNRMLFRNNPRY